MTSPLHPSEGIRMLLQRVSIGEEAANAEYTGQVFTPSEVFGFEVKLALDGSAKLLALPGDSPDKVDEEHEKSLLKLSKSIARAAKRKLEDKLPPWPPKILRWRGPGRG